jgi:hypothetical protein
MVRTIEIPEEQYQFLVKLAAIMKSQETKGTSFPLYCIYDTQDEEVRFIDMFLTEKAMNDHLIENEHNFSKPFTRIKSASYNEEISELMKIIVSLDDLVLEEHNNNAYGV